MSSVTRRQPSKKVRRSHPAITIPPKQEVSLPEAKKLIDLSISEKDFQDMVVDAAEKWGWLVHAERPAKSNKGWVTPIQGKEGFPDLVLCKPPRLILAELKSQKGKVSTPQQEWLDALAICTEAAIDVDVVLWRPSDFKDILAILGGDKI